MRQFGFLDHIFLAQLMDAFHFLWWIMIRNEGFSDRKSSSHSNSYSNTSSPTVVISPLALMQVLVIIHVGPSRPTQAHGPAIHIHSVIPVNAVDLLTSKLIDLGD